MVFANNRTTLRSAEPFVESKSILIKNFEYGAEPGYIYTLFRDDLHKEVTEIQAFSSINMASAYVTFNSVETAHKIAKQLDGTNWGPNNRVLATEVVPANEIPACKKDRHHLLTEFLRERDAESQFESCTVKITGLNPNRTEHRVDLLLERYPSVSDFLDPEEESSYIVAKQALMNEPGAALVKFDSIDTAEGIVDEFNGDYFKTGTIYVKCVPDNAIELYQNVYHQEQASRNQATRRKNGRRRKN